MITDTLALWKVYPTCTMIPSEVTHTPCIFLFSLRICDIFPYKPRVYTTKKLKYKKDHRTTLYYMPTSLYNNQTKDCITKLKSLNFDLTYGLARDSMKFLEEQGMISLGI